MDAKQPSAIITALQVQSSNVPLAVEDAHLVFSWQMLSNITGQNQMAYQIVFTRDTNYVVECNGGYEPILDAASSKLFEITNLIFYTYG